MQRIPFLSKILPLAAGTLIVFLTDSFKTDKYDSPFTIWSEKSLTIIVDSINTKISIMGAIRALSKLSI